MRAVRIFPTVRFLYLQFFIIFDNLFYVHLFNVYMKVIYNRYLPTKNFTAINLFGVVFARKEYKKLEEYEINHEKIHTYQIIELLGIFYYILYISEWLVRLCIYRNALTAYYNISFEREAYAMQKDFNYLKRRKFFSFIHYYKNK